MWRRSTFCCPWPVADMVATAVGCCAQHLAFEHALKMLVGYPVDGLQFGDANITAGDPPTSPSGTSHEG